MDTLHTVLRAIRGETKARTHLAVFREFLNHLDRIGRRARRERSTKTVSPKIRRSGKG